MPLSPHHLTDSVLRRFYERVQVGEPDECWTWRGTTASNKYGLLSVFGRNGGQVGPHRVAWVLTHQRPIPHRHHICHTCDNPPCCNPSHLFLGTASDNALDANAKGHKTGKPHYGEQNGLAKMTAQSVMRLRSLAADGVPQREIGKLFGLSQPTVSSIVRRETWRHVP